MARPGNLAFGNGACLAGGRREWPTMHGPVISLPWRAEIPADAVVAALLLAAAINSSTSGISAVKAELRKLCWPILLLLATVTWIGTRNSPPGRAVLVHYVALATIGLAATLWLVDFLPARRIRILGVGALVTAVVVLIYARSETYTLHWTGRNATQYDDTFRRWGGALVYRRFVTLSDEGLGWSEGPMVDGKRHGRWQHKVIWPPMIEDKWYWHDQLVTPEQWSRRGG